MACKIAVLLPTSCYNHNYSLDSRVFRLCILYLLYLSTDTGPDMNFFNLKSKPRTPPDIVRGLRDAITRLDSGAPGDTRRKVS